MRKHKNEILKCVLSHCYSRIDSSMHLWTYGSLMHVLTFQRISYLTGRHHNQQLLHLYLGANDQV